MKILILGAGAWGSALAVSACAHPQGHKVTLWARDSAQAPHSPSNDTARVMIPSDLSQSLDLVHIV